MEVGSGIIIKAWQNSLQKPSVPTISCCILPAVCEKEELAETLSLLIRLAEEQDSGNIIKADDNCEQHLFKYDL